MRVSNSLDLDQDRHLGPNCLQRLSADDKAMASKKIIRIKV